MKIIKQKLWKDDNGILMKEGDRIKDFFIMKDVWTYNPITKKRYKDKDIKVTNIGVIKKLLIEKKPGLFYESHVISTKDGSHRPLAEPSKMPSDMIVTQTIL